MEAPGDDGGPDAGTRARGLGRGRGRVDMITVLGKVEVVGISRGARKSIHVTVTVTV